MGVVIDDATEDDVARFYGISFPGQWRGRVMRRGKLVAAFAGVFESPNGEWFGVMDVPAHLRGLALYREAKRFLASASDAGANTIRAACDTDIPRAAEFMARLGFEPTDDETEDGKVIWQWLASEQ